MLFKFETGARVRDKVSGFAGVVTTRTEYLNGRDGALTMAPPARLAAYGAITLVPWALVVGAGRMIVGLIA